MCKIQTITPIAAHTTMHTIKSVHRYEHNRPSFWKTGDLTRGANAPLILSLSSHVLSLCQLLVSSSSFSRQPWLFFFPPCYWSRLEIETNLTSHLSSQRAFPPTYLSSFLRSRCALLCFACRHVETRTLRLRGDHICVQPASLSQYSLLPADTSRYSTRRRRRRAATTWTSSHHHTRRCALPNTTRHTAPFYA
ncbi:uncharacterized protein LY79DRAFT_215398 [Colletotrichum navitas]|uniref:Uncharacterized protein n=1 Tax=Colletotrichum navitas TaxID=681940 RepID=A0AAD8PZ56_9PEZI|nr:uncharacterized protein LY79DRAFT_215398 [Colletotrichum navitas]KAK1590616.1 hypothetical protein LY79DRAFT_215398 [Colletotrichum navitas]